MTHPPLGQLSLDDFLQNYWQKKPVLIRNAFSNFIPPVSADEIAGLALEEEVESRLILQSNTPASWQLQHGPFSEDFFASLPPKNWTLLVQSVDTWIPEAAEFVAQFNFIPNWRLDDLMVSYAADGGGVGPHYDNYDVFLIQASGTRRWEIGGLYSEDSPRRKNTPVMILSDWEAEQSWDLEPGDMLYLPPRVGHNGYAIGDDCMTYSVGFRAPSHQEIFDSFSTHLANFTKSEDRYTDPELSSQSHCGEISTAALNRVRDIFHTYLKQPELLATWFGQYMTELKNPEEPEPGLYDLEEIKALLVEGIPLCRNEGARLAFHQLEGQFILFYDGQSLRCCPRQVPLAKQLCQALTLTNIEPSEENSQLILTLVDQDTVFFLGE